MRSAMETYRSAMPQERPVKRVDAGPTEDGFATSDATRDSEQEWDETIHSSGAAEVPPLARDVISLEDAGAAWDETIHGG